MRSWESLFEPPLAGFDRGLVRVCLKRRGSSMASNPWSVSVRSPMRIPKRNPKVVHYGSCRPPPTATMRMVGIDRGRTPSFRTVGASFSGVGQSAVSPECFLPWPLVAGGGPNAFPGRSMKRGLPEATGYLVECPVHDGLAQRAGTEVRGRTGISVIFGCLKSHVVETPRIPNADRTSSEILPKSVRLLFGSQSIAGLKPTVKSGSHPPSSNGGRQKAASCQPGDENHASWRT